MEHKEKLNEYIKSINEYLDNLFKDKNTSYQIVINAMNYSLNAGGKRLRPIFVLEFCKMCGGDEKAAYPFAAAVEMIHTYSLIHDDMPCMDNDDLRRGKPTNHKVFGEATAMLAGDALLTEAFYTITKKGMEANLSSEQIAKAAECLSLYSGYNGMIGGQMIDMEHQKKDISSKMIEEMYLLKTAALFKASCVLGCIAANADKEKTEAAIVYAENLGLAFQIRDDILDVIGLEAALGKKTGSDDNNDKSTYLRLIGMEKAEELIEKYTTNSLNALKCFENNEFMVYIAQMLIKRDR